MNKPKKIISKMKDLNSLLNKFILFVVKDKNNWDSSALLYIYKINKKKKIIYYYLYKDYSLGQLQERSVKQFIGYIDCYYDKTYSI